MVSSQDAEILDEAFDDVLIAGLDDFVYLAELQSHVIEAAWPRGVDLVVKPDDVNADLRVRLGTMMVERVLGGGFMEPGELSPDGFQPWTVPTVRAIARITSEWRALGGALSLGNVCWFRNTLEGSNYAARVRDAAQVRWRAREQVGLTPWQAQSPSSGRPDPV